MAEFEWTRHSPITADFRKGVHETITFRRTAGYGHRGGRLCRPCNILPRSPRNAASAGRLIASARSSSGRALTARWIYWARWNAWRVVIKGYDADDVRSNVALQELAHFDSLFPTLTKTPRRRHRKKKDSAGARSTSSIDCSADAGDYYDYGDYSSAGDCGSYGDSGDFGDFGTPGGDTGGGSGGDTGGGGGDGVETKPFCPPFCPSQQWYAQQHGSVQMGPNGTLPDGSHNSSTEIDQSNGVVHGFIYHGSNGSQWYTGYNDGSRPETMDQFQRNMDALYAQYQKINNCV